MYLSDVLQAIAQILSSSVWNGISSLAALASCVLAVVLAHKPNTSLPRLAQASQKKC